VHDELLIVHRLRRDDLSESLPGAVVWKTCLRLIGFVDAHDLDSVGLVPGDVVLGSDEAYRFLLEVICGLRSPLVGETEVMAQFRQFHARLEQCEGAGSPLAQLCVGLLSDARLVRSRHLDGRPGGPTYGSLVRRHLRGLDGVAVLGAGHLAREVLASLTRFRSVQVVGRSRAKARALERVHPGIEAASLRHDAPSDTSSGRWGLVVAAPMTARAVARWLARQSRFFTVLVDLRAEGRHDAIQPSPGGPRVIDLKGLFEDPGTLSADLPERVTRARDEIRRRAEAWRCRAEVRPFGWEDLCA